MGKLWNLFKDRLNQNWYNLKRWLKIKKNDIMRWGMEKLTLMLIPHSEKKVWAIHISNFTLLFIGTVLGIAIVISIISISNKKTIDQKILRLEKQNQIKEEYISKFIDNINQLQNRFASFRSDINRIFSLVAIESKPDKLLSSPDISTEQITNQQDSHLKEIIVSKPREIDELYRIKKEIEIYKIQMQKFVSFVETSKRVLKSIPSIWPVQNGSGRITSKFGFRKDPFTSSRKFHTGVDIAHWPSTPVIASADGVVEFSGYLGGFGRVIKIKHNYGFTTLYAHLLRSYVTEGQRVTKGQVIGAIGNSGRATGYHLHYELRIGLENVDPIPFLSIRLF